MNQTGEGRCAVVVADPQRHLQAVQHQGGGHGGGDPPAQDPAGEHVEDQRCIHHSGPGRHISEIGHPQPVWTRGAELPVDPVGRPVMISIGDGGAGPLAAHRAEPALLPHQPFHRATGHIMAAAAQVQPQLPRPEPGHEPLASHGGHHLDQLSVPQRSPARRLGPRSVEGGRGDRTAVLGEHPADRLDPEPVTVSGDEGH